MFLWFLTQQWVLQLKNSDSMAAAFGECNHSISHLHALSELLSSVCDNRLSVSFLSWLMEVRAKGEKINIIWLDIKGRWICCNKYHQWHYSSTEFTDTIYADGCKVMYVLQISISSALHWCCISCLTFVRIYFVKIKDYIQSLVHIWYQAVKGTYFCIQKMVCV